MSLDQTKANAPGVAVTMPGADENLTLADGTGVFVLDDSESSYERQLTWDFCSRCGWQLPVRVRRKGRRG